MTLEDRFNRALAKLCHWYADSVKAQSFDGPSISHTKPGAVELRFQSYPDVGVWKQRWRLARSADERETVIAEIEEEYRNLGKAKERGESASQGLAEARYWLLDSGTYHGVEYRQAAVELQIEKSTVWEWRKGRGVNPHNGRQK